MVQLSREDAQTLIYRGCARLAQAMRVKRIAKVDAEEWESLAVLEAKMVLKVALRGPITVLRIPPLPLAVLEVQKQLEVDKRRSMRPSDIYSPYEQASSSAYKALMTCKDESEIPSDIDLGDPASFWWKDLKEASSDEESEEDSQCDSSDSESDVVEKQALHSPAEGGSHPLARPYKRSRANTPSDNEDDDSDSYVYIPKCKNCKSRDAVCRTPKAGAVCTPCRLRKRRCSARAKASVVTRTDASNVVPMNKKPQEVKESKSVIEMLPSHGTTSASGSQVDRTPITTEKKEMESKAYRPPSKRKRVYVAVPPLPFKPRMPPEPAEQLKIGPPGGKWKRQKRTEPDAVVGSTSTDSGSEVSGSSTTSTSSESTPGAGTPSMTLPVAMRTQTCPTMDLSPFDRLSNRQRRLLVALAPFLEAVLAEHA